MMITSQATVQVGKHIGLPLFNAKPFRVWDLQVPRSHHYSACAGLTASYKAQGSVALLRETQNSMQMDLIVTSCICPLRETCGKQ